MSDDWIFYLCQMGDDRASIFFDHGIKDSINDSTQSFLLRIRIKFKKPRPDGLSSQEEFDALCALEDDIEKAVDQNGSVYVGRITVGNARHLHIFTSVPEITWGSHLRVIGERHGYELDSVYEADEAKDGYWKELFPGPDDWQVIMDIRVLESLEKHGDDHSQERIIDHCVYLPTPVAQAAFTRWLEAHGYSVQGADMTEEQGIRVQFTHTGTVELSAITTHTIALRRKAEELGGDYDGWGTSVCT